MFASRSILLFLALFITIVNARPLHNHLRRSCRHNAIASAVGASVEPSTVSAPASTLTSSPTAVSGGLKADPTPIVDDGDAPEDVQSSSSRPSPSASVSSSRPPAPSSTSKSADKPVPTQSLNANTRLSSLFPVSSSAKSWSTSSLADSPLPLSDSTLRPTRLLSALSHDYVSAHGKQAMRAKYPKGSYTFGFQPQGGLSFYAPGPKSVDLTTAKEATFGYSVYFADGFAFQKGGKLPGLYGGNTDDGSIGCSGGSRSTACFSARLMWRAGGDGEFYTYLPPVNENKKQCNVPPFSECNSEYGASVGRGAFKFATGEWTTVSERVRLNDVGQANGELELFVNGKSEISLKGLILRNSNEGKIRGIQMQTFFGGSSFDFASPKDQEVFFADFSTAITQSF